MLSNFASVTDRITSLFLEQVFLCQLFLSAPRNCFFVQSFSQTPQSPYINLVLLFVLCSVSSCDVPSIHWQLLKKVWTMSNNPTTPFFWCSCIRCHLHRCTPVLLRSRDYLDLGPIHTSIQLHTGPFPSWGSHTAPFWWRLLSP